MEWYNMAGGVIIVVRLTITKITIKINIGGAKVI